MKKLFGRFKERSSMSETHGASAVARRSIDVAPQIIVASSRALVEGIEQILFDSGSLSGEDTSGFYKLISLIESTPQSEEIHIISGSHGLGCVSILLKYILHASFVDSCVQANLAPALLHALRLLRMMEVKTVKPAKQQQQAQDDSHENDSEGMNRVRPSLTTASVTLLSSERLCELLIVLCGSTQIVEQLRPSLTKLLCLPLSPLPDSGIHFQTSVSRIVESICKSGLTSPIIWALRDSQTVMQMTRALRDLTSTVNPPSGKTQTDVLLKGLRAEERGMWVVASSCLVELLNAADTFSPVLMTDFESCGGFDLLVDICLHSSATRSMQILNNIIILLVGDSVDKPLLHPHVGEVLERILRTVLGLPACSVTGEETVQELVLLSNSIANTPEDKLDQREYILQNMSYSLLTLYSSHPQNYVLLESAHFLLPMLTLCLPLVRDQEPFAAVLKALDFVCSERCDLICVKSLCASVSILVKRSVARFSSDSDSDSSTLHNSFLQCITFCEEVMCRDTDYALVFFKHGLQLIFYESFSQIPSHLNPTCSKTEGVFSVYQTLVDMMVRTIHKHPLVCEEVVQSGVHDLVMSLISSREVDTQYVELLLTLPERLAKTNDVQYEPVLLLLMEALLSLGKDRNVHARNMQKLKGVIDCVGRILACGSENASAVWCSVLGFEGLVHIIESLEGLFSVESVPLTASAMVSGMDMPEGQGLSDYICLQSVIECLAIALNASSGGSDTAHDNRIYFRRMIKYPKLADALKNTHVFSSVYAENFVSFLFKLVSGAGKNESVKTQLLLNPDAFALILDILPYISLGTAISTISRIKDIAFSQIDGCQMLSEGGLIRLLVKKYHSVLRDRSHALNEALFDLLRSVSERYLTAIDFKNLFQYLVRPDAITDEKSGKLLPVWMMEEWGDGSITDRSWDSVKLLIDLTESPSLASNAAYVLMGHGAIPRAMIEAPPNSLTAAASALDPAHLRMQWSEVQMGKVFPLSGFSFTSWIQLGTATREGVAGVAAAETGNGQGTIPIFALQGEGGGVFELQFDTTSSNARIISRGRGGKAKAHSFSIPYFDEHEWHLVVITMKKQKKMIKAAQVGLELFFDGQLIHSDKFDADKIPAHGPVVDIFVGKSLVGEVVADMTGERGRSSNPAGQEGWLNLWHLGPVLLFDEALNQVQISRIMTKGASYSGSFQGESPLEGCLSTRATEVLRRCNSTFLDLDTLLGSLGLAGLELLVFSPHTRDETSSLFEDLPSLPVPTMAYNANSSFLLKSSNGAPLSSMCIGLHNSASDFSVSPHAELCNGWHFSRMDSVPRCLGSLGGPALLLPLVQAASTERQLVMALDLLRACLSNDSANLNYMHNTGFGVLGFLLSRKSKSLITESVFTAMFSMAVDRGLKSAQSSVFSILLVDTLALSYLLLNHQVWDPLRPEFALLMMTSLRSLVCEDARHGVLNAKRLALMGVSQWILLFLVCVTEECGNSESSYNDKGNLTKLASSHLSTSSNRSTRGLSAAPAPLLDGDDFIGVKFLIQTSVYVLKALLMTLLQRDVIDLISKVIVTSLSGELFCGDNIGQRTRDYLGVCLIRILGEVYTYHRELEVQQEKSRTFHIFCSSLSPDWFLAVLEKAHDHMTLSSALLLMGAMLQKDMQFRNSFCKHDSGLKLLHGIVTSDEYCIEENCLSVVLPLVALLFQIPVKFLPSPVDATLPNLVVLMERCSGPLANDLDAKEFTLPVFSILLAYFSKGARAHFAAGSPPPVQNMIISGMLKKAMITSAFSGMRDIMQQRAAVEILTSSLLMSSNACDDYGTRILSSGDSSLSDLSLCLQENYIGIDTVDDGNKDARCRSCSSSIDTSAAIDSSDDCVLSQVELIVKEGDDLVELLDLVLANAIFKYSNPHLVTYFFLAFPSHMTESYVCGYQSLLFESVKSVLQSAFEEMEMAPLQAACDVFSLLLPLAQAGVLHTSVLQDLLMMNLYGLDAVASPEASNWLGLEKHSMFLKDIGSSARCYAVLNCQKVMNTGDGWEGKLTILQLIRSNLHLLCMPRFDELSDPVALKSRRDVDVDKVTGAVAVLEAFNMSICIDNAAQATSKRSDNALLQVVSEKTRTSLVFCLYLVTTAYALFLDDEKKIRNEALRMCAALLIHRQQFMTDLFSQRNSKKAGDSDDPESRNGPDLHKGFLMLVPSAVGSASLYSKLLRQINTNFEDEDKRIAEFSFWLTDNRGLCDLVFNSLDLSTAIASPRHLLSTTNSIKDLICEKVKVLSLGVSDDQLLNSLTECVLNSHKDYISEEKRQWTVFGVSEVAGGALHWKDAWLCQQSCPVWGNAPVTSEDTVYAIGGNEDSLELTFSPLSERSDFSERHMAWKLSAIGGPEKVRRLMEQDYEAAAPHRQAQHDIEQRPSSLSSVKGDLFHSDDVTEALDSNASPRACGEEQNSIEDLLIKIAQNPLLRKSGGDQEYDDNLDYVGDIDDDENDDDDDDEGDRPDGDGDTDVDREVYPEGDHSSDIDDMDDAVVVEAPDDYTFPGDETKRFSIRNFASRAAATSGRGPSVAVGGERLTASDIDATVMRRGRILAEIVRGAIGPADWEQSQTLNIDRVSGLEARKALLVLTPHHLHILDGFQMNTHATQSELIPVVWHEIVSQKVVEKETILTPAEVVAAAVLQKEEATAALDASHSHTEAFGSTVAACTERSKDNGNISSVAGGEGEWLRKVWYQLLHADYGHFKMPINKVYTIFKRRYELQNRALEVTDVHGHSLLFACENMSDCDATLKRLVEMNMPLSIFKKVGVKKLQLAGGGLFVYRRATNLFLANVTKLWQHGSMTNFDYLMHLNIIAGRSFQDLTQYPVFPWVLADYESETLDFTSSKTFRDLSKPMGALGARRIGQYEERYRTMEEFYNEGIEEATPPYFYGTHYSCAGYVLYYMLRIQPYSRMAKTLQGGNFDTADRLFKAIHGSWLSSSQENLQDVRELIPEFYFLPDFLKNSNKFDFGETQKGEVVDDVVLPPWAGGDSIEFVRKHREALESKYVSEHLHLWIDLIFGYRQRGPAAKSAQNMFMPLTYSGEVDIDSITDPMLRAATISQINNFGQTPARLFAKPHPKRHVPDIIKATPTQEGISYAIDTTGLQWHERMTPPLNVVGKSPVLWVSPLACHAVSYPNNLKSGSPVGDVRLVGRDRVVAVPKGCALLPPRFGRFIRFGKSSGGISIHAVHSPTARTAVTAITSQEKEVSIYEQLHPRMISCVATSSDGEVIATGGLDRSVRIWHLCKKTLEHHASFVGHSGPILSVDVCASFSLVVSGSEDRTAMIWDCSSQPKLLHILNNHKGPVVSVSINPICGSITTLTSYELRLYSINGVLLASVNFLDDSIARMNNSKPTFKLKGKVVLAPPAGEWQQDAVVAVTGHDTGHVLLWKLVSTAVGEEQPTGGHIRRELVPSILSRTHSASVCSIRLCPSVVTKPNNLILRPFDGESHYELLVGDCEGFVSRWAPAKLDHMSATELQEAVDGGKLKNIK